MDHERAQGSSEAPDREALAADEGNEMNLRQAIKVRNLQRDPKEFKIGIIRSTYETQTISGHRAGNVVLFRREDGDTCTIETPMSNAMIKEQRSRGSGLTTIGTCVGFPRRYIEEVKI